MKLAHLKSQDDWHLHLYGPKAVDFQYVSSGDKS